MPGILTLTLNILQTTPVVLSPVSSLLIGEKGGTHSTAFYFLLFLDIISDKMDVDIAHGMLGEDEVDMLDNEGDLESVKFWVAVIIGSWYLVGFSKGLRY